MKKLLSVIVSATLMTSALTMPAVAQEKAPEAPKMSVETTQKVSKDIAVQIQDKEITGNQAIVMDGRTLLPFRAVFEELGAQVSYDAVKKQIDANYNDMKLQLNVGSKVAIKTVENKAENKDMQVAPIVRNEQTYIPLRDLANLTGLEVEYSSLTRKVNLYDKDKLIKDIDQNFTIYNQMVKNAGKTNYNQTFKNNTEMKGDFQLIDKNQVKKASGTLVFDGLSKGVDLSGKFKLNVNLGDFEKEAFANMSEKDIQIAKSLLVSDHQVIMDNSKGVMYLKSDAASLLFDKQKDAWLKLDFANILGAEFKNAMNMNYMQKLMDNPKDLTFGSMIFDITKEQRENMPADVMDHMPSLYDQIKMSYRGAALMLGDDGFVKDGSNYVLNLDKKGLENRVKKYFPELADQVDLSMLSDLNYKLAFSNIDSATPRIEMKINGKAVDKNSPVADFDFSMDGNNHNANMNFSVDVKDKGKFVLTLKAVTTATSDSLQLTPPAGATVVDVE